MEEAPLEMRLAQQRPRMALLDAFPPAVPEINRAPSPAA